MLEFADDSVAIFVQRVARMDIMYDPAALEGMAWMAVICSSSQSVACDKIKFECKR